MTNIIENKFYDVCVQLCILGYLLDDEDKKHCFDMTNKLLTNPDFDQWTQYLKLKDIEETAWIFVNHYGEDLIPEVQLALPKAMTDLMTSIKHLKVENALNMAKLKHEATKCVFRQTKSLFDEILLQQKEHIYQLEWKNLKQ